VKNRSNILLVLAVLTVILVADQVTKAMIVAWVNPIGQHVGTERTFFYIVYEQNPGLVFGSFRSSPWVVRVAPVIATLVLVYLYRHLDSRSWLQSAAFGLVAGGAVGNLIDRFFRGIVVDFLQFNFYFLEGFLGLQNTRYPAFNIADTAICTGVALLIFGWHRMGAGETADVPDAS
jgi:signal peptidase II